MIPLFRMLVSLASGLLFGLGLSLSGMLDPARVRAFLDVTGAWNPSLIVVLGAGVIVAFIGYRIAFAAGRPWLDTAHHLPGKSRIDRSLILGAAIFGVGWGLAGYCPGPAIASLSLGLTPAAIFVAAMALGMVFHDRLVASKG